MGANPWVNTETKIKTINTVNSKKEKKKEISFEKLLMRYDVPYLGNGIIKCPNQYRALYLCYKYVRVTPESKIKVIKHFVE